MMWQRLITTLFLLFSFPLHALNYQLTIKNETIDIEACMDQLQPAFRFSRTVQKYIKFIETKAANCTTYQFNYIEAFQDASRLVKRQVDTYFTNTENWLLLPQQTVDKDIRITIRHPKRMKISVPWRRVDDQAHFLSQSQNFEWPTVMAFGDLQQFSYQLGNHTASISFSSAITEMNAKRLLPWIKKSLKAIYDLKGHFPTKETQILLSPASRGDEPVPFAQVMRGGEPSLHFYIKADYPLADFQKDWTAYHETAHLLLPFIDRDYAWVSEGLASYYQYLVMEKAKVLGKNGFWERLYGGIQRGEASHRRNAHLTLSEATPQMFSNGAVRRIYWAGAVTFLRLDYKLRTRSKNPTTLAKVLYDFNQQYMPNYRTWTASDLAKALDDVSSSRLFSREFNLQQSSTSFPDYQAVFNSLGITIDNDKLKFSKAAEQTKLRDSFIAE